jgi:ribonuclease BN (tRNA processing enzyme)
MPSQSLFPTTWPAGAFLPLGGGFAPNKREDSLLYLEPAGIIVTGMQGRGSQVVLLGTGTPNADPKRAGPAVAIVVDGAPYLVDVGAGVVRRAAAAFERGVEGPEVSRLNRAFVTHLHSDHTVGYPDLILTPWVLGRTEPLAVYGPVGLQAMTEHILAAYAEDIKERLEGPEPANRTGYAVRAHEISPGLVYQDENVRVEAFRANHGSWPAYGYKFHTPDRVIAISGDTAPTEGLVDAYRGCDVVVHEVYSRVGFARLTPAWQNYHARFHTSSEELAVIMSQAKPGLLILYHQLFHGVPEGELLQEVKGAYEGEVVSGRDLEVY